jgi:hypothetical protein
MSMTFFTEIEKKNTRIHMEPQRNPNSQKQSGERRKLGPSHYLISKYILKL